VGFIAATMIGAGAVWTIGVPVVFFLSWFPARRLARLYPRWSAVGIASILTIAFCVSCLFFLIGQEAIAANHLVVYWTIKLIAIYLALFASIALSATWEEALIWNLTKRPESTNYFGTVIRANIYVLLFIMLFGAIVMLPKRLKSPDFLTNRAHPHLVAAEQQQRNH
jgi:hypothetical protein